MKRLYKSIFIMSVLCSATVDAQIEQTEALCPAGIPETSNDADLQLMPNGEILHIASNLIFMRCSIGQTWDGASCLGEPTAYTWQQALEVGQSTLYLDNNSWRLPNVKELAVIVERACVRPSINDAVFPNTSPDDYWTSSPSLLDEGGAWSVTFTNGSNTVKLKNRTLFVRLVRNNMAD